MYNMVTTDDNYYITEIWKGSKTNILSHTIYILYIYLYIDIYIVCVCVREMDVLINYVGRNPFTMHIVIKSS